ncbi:MAG TPA: hypothetical protein VGF41_13445, partial [Myxococcaceae bacterium]
SAVPFEVPVGTASVRGAIDLLLVGPPGAAAVCLVPGRQAGGATAKVLVEALRRRSAEGLAVRAAVFPVDGDEERLHWASEPPVAPSSIVARLTAAVALGPALAEGIERSACEALGCGFLPRCHPRERGL